MAKAVVFSFRDISKEIKVGDKIYYRPAHLRRTEGGSDYVIQKIGNKLIQIGYELNGRAMTSFYFDGSEKTDYSGGSIYTSREAYLQMCEEQKVIDEVRAFVRDSGYKAISYQQALKIKEILGME